VPPAMHVRLAHAEKLPLFQMIAKNVGIRRARGRFVLATNIDILFSDNVICFMRDRLRGGRLYRVDRGDVPPTIPVGTPFEQVLTFCASRMFRIHKRNRSLVKRHGRWERIRPQERNRARIARLLRLSAEIFRRLQSRAARLLPHLCLVFQVPRVPRAGSIARLLRQIRCTAWRVARVPFVAIRSLAARHRQRLMQRLRIPFDRRYRLHTNACGDFTLLSREDWFRLRGYPEWEIFSWHLDSVLLHQAIRSDISEIEMRSDHHVYHIEHSIGSGYTPEGADALFARLEEEGLPYIDWPLFLQIVAEMDRKQKEGRLITYNGDQWGLADVTLPEISIESAVDGRVL